MKALFLLLLFALFSLNSLAQDVTPPAGGVEDVYLAKDDGEGKAGDVVTTFGISDIPIHCIVQLDTVKIATVKMNLVAVSVPGVKPETKVVTTSYTTKGNQNQVNFTGRPDKVWTPGKYRVEFSWTESLRKATILLSRSRSRPILPSIHFSQSRPQNHGPQIENPLKI